MIKTVEDLEKEIATLKKTLENTTGEREKKFIQQNITARTAQLSRMTEPPPHIETRSTIGK